MEIIITPVFHHLFIPLLESLSSGVPVINLRGTKGSHSLPNISLNGVYAVDLLNCVLAANTAG